MHTGPRIVDMSCGERRLGMHCVVRPMVEVVSYDGDAMATDGVITRRHAQGKNWEGV